MQLVYSAVPVDWNFPISYGINIITAVLLHNEFGIKHIKKFHLPLNKENKEIKLNHQNVTECKFISTRDVMLIVLRHAVA